MTADSEAQAIRTRYPGIHKVGRLAVATAAWLAKKLRATDEDEEASVARCTSAALRDT